MKEMICICCPMGCRLQVDDSDLNNIAVTGNTCPRGAKYAKDEVICPKRVVTSVVRVEGGEINMVSVKTADVIPKDRMFDALALLEGNKERGEKAQREIYCVVGSGHYVVKGDSVQLQRQDSRLCAKRI